MTAERIELPCGHRAIAEAVARGDYELAAIMCRFQPGAVAMNRILTAIRDDEALLHDIRDRERDVLARIDDNELRLQRMLEGEE